MRNIIFVTPPDARHGFELAGARQVLTDREGALQTIGRLVAAEEGGLVVIDERLLDGIDEQRLQELEKKWAGAFIILPGPSKAGGEVEDYARSFIARTIGYHVRINP